MTVFLFSMNGNVLFTVVVGLFWIYNHKISKKQKTKIESSFTQCDLRNLQSIWFSLNCRTLTGLLLVIQLYFVLIFFYVFSFHMAFTSFTWSTICCVFFSVEISSKKTISDCCLRNCRQIHLNNLIGRYRKTRSRGRKCRKKFKQLTKMNK